MPRTKAPKPTKGPHERALEKMPAHARAKHKARLLAEFEWPDAWDIDLGRLNVDQVKLDGSSLWVFLSSPDFPCDPDGYYFVNPPLKVPDGTWRDEERNGETVEVENTVEDVEKAFIQIVSEAATYYATHPEVHGRTTLTVFSTAADGIIESVGSTYAAAVAGSGTIGALTNAGLLAIGQWISGSDKAIDVSFLDFDTSSIPDSATVDSAVASLFGQFALIDTTNFTSEMRLYNWTDPLTTSDWRSPAQLASATLLASFASSGFTAEAYNAFSDVAFPANVNKTGVTRVLVCSDLHRTEQENTDGELLGFYEADETGTTKDPKLVINYTESEESPLRSGFGAIPL